MSDQQWPVCPIDVVKYRRNNDRVSPEYLVPFWGKQVAWHADGTHIVAAAATDEQLNEKLRELGIPANQVVFGYVDDPNVVQI
jgi:hypothetical protein